MADLRKIDELEQACADVVEAEQEDPGHLQWGDDLREFLVEVRTADLQTRAGEEFQRKIWDHNPVTSVGQGHVSVDAAISDPDFRSWLARQSLVQLPDTPEARASTLDTLFDELETRLGRYTNRIPRLKIHRMLAGFFPSDLTTVSSEKQLRELHSALFGDLGNKGPTCHSNILRRLCEAIGPAGDDLDAVVDRMRLPWLLFKHYMEPSDEEQTESSKGASEQEGLVPLPAASRIKGLSGLTGGRPALLNILEFCRDGASREDLQAHVNTVFPKWQHRSITRHINVIQSELNCLKSDGDQFVLTDRGK